MNALACCNAVKLPLRLLLIAGLALAVSPTSAPAQDQDGESQRRYIAELKQRNAAYGPGCNGIGISVPQTVDMPDEISTPWVAGHSACIPGLRLVVACLGEVVGDDRAIGCTLRGAEGQAAVPLTCDRFTLIAADARLDPDRALSRALADGSEGGSQSCEDAAALAAGVSIAAAFIVPATTSTGDLALLLDIDGAEVPAYLIPAGQLGSLEQVLGE